MRMLYALYVCMRVFTPIARDKGRQTDIQQRKATVPLKYKKKTTVGQAK